MSSRSRARASLLFVPLLVAMHPPFSRNTPG
jgi:hypothetical protein